MSIELIFSMFRVRLKLKSFLRRKKLKASFDGIYYTTAMPPMVIHIRSSVV